MKILYHHRTQSKDGQAVHIHELIRALRAEGCEVIVVEPAAASSTEFGGESRLVGWVRRVLPRAAYELLELAYNVVAYRALKRAYLTHRPDVLYERHNLFLVAGAWLKRRYGVPYLLEVNAPLYEERAKHGGLGLRRLARWTERYAWRTADVVLPVTRVLAGMVAAEHVPGERIQVISNGIDPEAFARVPAPREAKAQLGLTGKTVLGFTGFVRDWHGLGDVVDYVAKSGRDDLVLLVVGDGPARAALEAQASRLGIGDRVRFTGVVAREDIPRHVAAFDIALQPAATLYASPLKLFEYMALGCAILAPAQPNIQEVLEDGMNGLLFRPSDTDAFASALGRLVADPRLRASLGRNARETLEKRRYTWRENAKRVVALARPLVARDPSAGRRAAPASQPDAAVD